MAIPRGNHSPLEIHFYCKSVPFTAKTIALKTSLGGSESALVFLARGLAELGNRVVVYTKLVGEDGKPTGGVTDSYGVRWFDHELMEGMVRARQPEVFVSLRMPEIMEWHVLQDCGLRILWNEDLLSDGGRYLGHSYQVDRHVFVSEYHREQYCHTAPCLRELSHVTRNPVDLRLIEESIKGVKKQPKRLIHVSRPERALIDVARKRSPLLEILNRLRETDPEITLGLCRYHSMYEGSPAVDAICRRADELVANAEGVEWLGELDKASLYREIAKAQLVVYPGVWDFAETGCIAATEARACGTPMIASRIGALPETLNQGGVLIDGNACDEEYQERFVGAVQGLLGDPKAYKRLRSAGRRGVERWDYRIVASQWDGWLHDEFKYRFEKNRGRVLRSLLWRDDLRSARLLAPYVEGGQERLDGVLADARPESPKQYAATAQRPEIDERVNARLNIVREAITRAVPDVAAVRRVLDVGCGNGVFSGLILDTCPNAQVTLLDYSQPLLDVATSYLAEHEGAVGRYEAICGTLDVIPEGAAYDLVFAGEIAEHFADTEAFLRALEARCRRPDGAVVVTTPCGPFAGFMHRNSLDWSQHTRAHQLAIDARDIEAWVGHKAGYGVYHLPILDTPRGEPAGHHVWWWRADDQEIGRRNDWRHIVRTRPYESLAVCMIVRDAEQDILRALKSVDAIADEVWIADTGSMDRTMELARPFVRNGGDVWSIGCCPDAPAHLPPPRDFGWARNQSISKTAADWILWIDADEELQSPQDLRRHLATSPFNGMVVRQCHLTLDSLTEEMVERHLPFRYDKPVRVFRRVPVGEQAGRTYRCQAVIHEHFQASLNEVIAPAFELGSVQIAHWGYLHEQRRRTKCEYRNLPLMWYDRERYPDRKLGPLLEAREYTNLAKWEWQEQRVSGNQQPVLRESRDGLRRAVALIQEHYWDPTDEFWSPALEVYQDALRMLGDGLDYGVYEALDTGQMRSRVYRFASVEDYEAVQRHTFKRLREIGKPAPIRWDDGSVVAAVPTVEAVVGGPRELTAIGETTSAPTPA